jgi:coenzyme F420-dependent glucose-6-phosphate dehydrogenase
VNWELRTPEDFDTATRFVRPEDMRQSVWISSDLGWHVARIAELIELGFEEIYLHQVGRNQKAFIEAFGTHVLPQLHANVQ